MPQTLNIAVASSTLVRRSQPCHIVLPSHSSRSIDAKYRKRIRVKTEAARTVSPPTRQPKKIRRHPIANSGATAHKAAVGVMSKIYRDGNHKRAKSLAPRTPYLRTSGVVEMSDVFISRIWLRRTVRLRQARPVMYRCKQRRNPGLACSQNVRPRHGQVSR
jgi:hypothetical protein